ncbi:MAG: sigma-70 family RNA polymerase sigma factor [Lachnospiraceae bacterium]|nr:sigma-70 family RNA polymerase sigma factor [Lachnospiraceae bacterium]
METIYTKDNKDSEIVKLYLDRNERAIEESIALYGKYCFTIADNILRNNQDSEECVNDTWVRAWNTIPPQVPKILKIFLAKITRNLSIDKYNARNAQKRGAGNIALAFDELEECIVGTKEIDGEIMAKQLEKTIISFVEGLKERDRDVFIRRYFYFEPIAEISVRYKMTEGNVFAVLSRIRKKLKKYLKEEGYVV